MQVSVKLNPSMTVTLDVSDQKDLFRQVSSLQEVCGADKCGACQSENVNFCVRNAVDGKKTYEFFEMRCRECNARLSFGAHQEGGTLFPKRKDTDGNWLENSGWIKFKKTNNDSESAKSKKKNLDDSPF